MGENPSHFPSATRPVEQVSWNDCQAFIERLNGLVDGLTLSLPSEAQWEYACRAKTQTATYAGDVEILGTCNAPILDPIAWYAGNCGVDFELSGGVDISGFPQPQYTGTKGGTHPVGARAPNAWGLHDMLGNVFEWCADVWRPGYDDEPSGDESAAPDAASAHRVFRGGSWSSSARGVRAAYRTRYDPGYLDADLGFRCGEFRASQVEPGGSRS
jgi:formylglycine-generating enzyme required for sulfatase activity